MKFTIALAQIGSVPGNPARNVESHIRAIGQAKEGGADLVVFPELSLTGYLVGDGAGEMAVSPGREGYLGRLQGACGGIAAIVGGIEESGNFGLHNCAFLVTGDGITTLHRKIYLPNYGMFEEKRYFLPGNRVSAFNLPFERVGVLICEDLWHLPLPYLLALDGARMIIGLSASPTRLAGAETEPGGARINGEQNRAIARLLSVYLCFCNRVGYEQGMNFWGGSSVIGPSGETVANAALFSEEILFAEIDPDAVRRARRISGHFLDDDPHFTARELARILRREGKTS